MPNMLFKISHQLSFFKLRQMIKLLNLYTQ